MRFWLRARLLWCRLRVVSGCALRCARLCIGCLLVRAPFASLCGERPAHHSPRACAAWATLAAAVNSQQPAAGQVSTTTTRRCTRKCRRRTWTSLRTRAFSLTTTTCSSFVRRAGVPCRPVATRSMSTCRTCRRRTTTRCAAQVMHSCDSHNVAHACVWRLFGGRIVAAACCQMRWCDCLRVFGVFFRRAKFLRPRTHRTTPSAATRESQST